MKKFFPWVLAGIIITVFALATAIVHLQTQLVFGFDQARDAFSAYAIWHNFDLKILGPTTDIPGVFHGVLWYYFLALAYFLGRTPQNAALLSLLMVFFSVPFVGLLTQKLFKNIKLTILVVALYVLSPLFQIFSRWLSNPSLALLITPLLLLSLWSYLTRPSIKSSLFSGLMFGALIQANFAYGIMLLIVPIYLWFFHSRPKLFEAGAFAFGLLVATTSFLAGEIKFGGQSVLAIANFLSKEGANPSASTVVLNLFDRIFNALAITVLPWPKLVAIIFLAFLVFTPRRQSKSANSQPLAFLLIWLFGYVIFQMFSSAVVGSAFILATFVLPVCVLFAWLLIRSRFAVLVIFIFAVQILTIFQWAKNSFSPISVQRAMFITDEEKLVDYTYEQAKNQPFIIMTITNPLYINTTWAYLYQFYGQPKYKYLPFWAGPDQAGYLGNLPQKPFGENLRYLIIEDTSSITEFYVAKIIYEEDKVSDIVEQKSFGTFRVQKRIFHLNKGPITLPEALHYVSPDLLK